MEGYTCIRCKEVGTKGVIPYKIIKDIDGEAIKFVGQLCNKCYKELFEITPAPEPSEPSELSEPSEKEENKEEESQCE